MIGVTIIPGAAVDPNVALQSVRMPLHTDIVLPASFRLVIKLRSFVNSNRRLTLRLCIAGPLWPPRYAHV